MTAAMTTQQRRKAAASRIGLAVLLAVFELALALMSGIAWRALALGQVTAAEAASLLLLGASALAGLPVAILIGYQNLLTRRAETADTAAKLGRGALGLSALRFVCYLAAAVVLIFVVHDREYALSAGCLFATGLLDAGAALTLATLTKRRAMATTS
jgi:hypothetical protein